MVALATVLISSWSCQNQKNEPESEPSTIVFSYAKTQAQFAKASEGCQSDSNECASIVIDYPQFKEQTPGFQKINDSILQQIKKSLSLEDDKIGRNTSLEDLGNLFVQDYNEYTAEAKTRAEEESTEPFITPWSIEISGEVTYESPKVISIALNNYAYTGGAHPNSNVSLFIYNVHTGQLLRFKDLIKDRTKLNKRVEQKFREINEIGPHDNLNEKGFFWDGKFQLPANIGLVPEGVQFFYNSYEIAAYAVGPTEFVLTWEELGDLLDLSKVK
jgi:hypothetical protein